MDRRCRWPPFGSRGLRHRHRSGRGLDRRHAFSGARDISWRLGRPHNLWEPMLWNVTSGSSCVALLPMVRRGRYVARAAMQPVRTPAAAFVALAFAFSGLHIAGMGLLRELAYGLGGWTYTFPWSSANSLRNEEGPVQLPRDGRHLLVRRTPGRRRAGASRAAAPIRPRTARIGEAGAVASRRPHAAC